MPGESNPADLAELAARHPDASFICAHTGNDWERGIRAIRAAKNVCAEFCGSDPTAGFVEMAVRELGAERVSYGSDAGGRSFASQLAKVYSADLPEATKRLILGGNLRRLLRPILEKKGMKLMIIDVNANLSRWPFRRTPCDELPRLIEKYRKYGVQQAWVGSLDGLFHRDMGGVNLRLAEACRQERRVKLVPFGSVNPMLPDWQEDVRRCAEEYHMPGIRLHPNYHGYKLDEPVAAELLDLAAQRGLIVQLAVRMDDIRVQHPLMRIPDVDTKPLAGAGQGPAGPAPGGAQQHVRRSETEDLRTLAADGSRLVRDRHAGRRRRSGEADPSRAARRGCSSAPICRCSRWSPRSSRCGRPGWTTPSGRPSSTRTPSGCWAAHHRWAQNFDRTSSASSPPGNSSVSHPSERSVRGVTDRNFDRTRRP